MTGGAFGSILAQLLHLTAAERKTLLVAGRGRRHVGDVRARRSPPMLLAVELLLFELKPRSLVPVALASVAARGVRRHLLGAGPLFPVPADSPPSSAGRAGLAARWSASLAGGMSGALTAAVYAAEDLFARLPAALDVVAGAGRRSSSASAGWSVPQALGVGYDAIRRPAGRRRAARRRAAADGVKAAIWAIALGSGTSGGVLAPLLIMGGALGVAGGRVPARRRRLLAAGQHGGHPGRDDARAAHGVVFASS